MSGPARSNPPGVTAVQLADEAATRGNQIETLSDLIQDETEARSALDTRVTTVENTGGGAILPWQAARYYALGAPMTQGGATYTRNVAGVARGTFDATEQGRWTVLPVAAQSGSTASSVANAIWSGSAWTYSGATITARPPFAGKLIWLGGGADQDPTPAGLGYAANGDLWIPSEVVE